MLATTLSPLSWAPCSVVSLPLMTVRLRSASTTVSTCVVPLPLPLPLAVLADTYQPVCAPMLKPISPLPLLFFDDCVWSSVSLRRVMLSRAASATLSPFTRLPMMLRSPAVATMLTSPWLRMVLPTADWSWLVWLALELEAPMPMRRLTPSVAPEAPCCMAPPTPAAALAACTAYSAFRRSSCALPAALAAP